MIPAIEVDLNSDLGEGLGPWTMGDDLAMLDIVSSANIACGFHGGDPSIMRSTCAAAAERGVAVGAHVSYHDVAGFGRRFIDVDPVELRDAVTYQIGALDAFARIAGTRVGFVKPHGALYNAIVHHHEQAAAVVAAVADWATPALPLLGLPGSVVEAVAGGRGVPFVAEAFADRAYTADGRLAPRSLPGAVLHDADLIAARVVRLVVDQRVASIDGAEISIAAQSVCVHGDTAGAVVIASAVQSALRAAGVTLRPFAR